MSQKFEYLIDEHRSYQNNVQFYLNEKGKEGWELISVFRHVDTKEYTFKRIIK